MADQYEPYENFHTRLKVQTAYPDGVKDHREGFQQREYFKNNQNEPQDTEPTGFAPMKGVVKAPRKKTKADLDIEAANNKDIKNRRIKNQ